MVGKELKAASKDLTKMMTGRNCLEVEYVYYQTFGKLALTEEQIRDNVLGFINEIGRYRRDNF